MKDNVFLESLDSHFKFGQNWSEFVKNHLSRDRIELAKISLIEFIGTNDLKGKTFLDIGCGSGLFSLAAYELGASTITSFDFDPNSVECCKRLRSTVNDPPNWNILQGSVLNEEFISTFDKADIVYSWGVLHHTGNMWKAIDHAAELVKPSGLLYIAIYNRVTNGVLTSEFWRKEKKVYNSSPKFVRLFLQVLFGTGLIFQYIFQRKNPINEIKNYRSFRGMNWKIDLVDWIGGYPYECATVDEIQRFLGTKLKFILHKVNANNGHGCSEYLFQKP